MLQIDLSGKTALVTGATGQLGRVMIRTLARAGADVVIHFQNNERMAKELLTEAQGMGRRGFVVQADITEREPVREMKRKVDEVVGAVDIVVANAVIQYQWTSVLEQAPEDYESQFKSCVLQNVYLAQTFVPGMIEHKWGRMIGINTECSMQNFPGQSAYVAGKRGMDGVYRVLAKEVGEHGITVNQVAPGWTISDRDRVNHTERSDAYDNAVPLKRRGTDQEIANTVAFLASDLAGYITGAYIPVSGGNVMPAI
jgi:3-oxoacyl-[acyl-carrier protein] reductase